MRVAFVCSSLEPGRDGVGDYTRQLAGELARMGHRVLLLALHDRWLDHKQSQEQDGLETMRWNSSSPVETRTRRARKALEQFDPDWVSLQYVCYGFHPKGLPWQWNRNFNRLLPTRAKLHLMFHELWIGATADAPAPDRLVGWLQRMLLARLIRDLRPSAVSTSNKVYASLLASLVKEEVSILPLFGAIPVCGIPESQWIQQECAKAGAIINEQNRSSFAIAGIFATFRAEWPAEPFLTFWREASLARGQRPVLMSAGRLGVGQAHWDDLARGYESDITFVQLGERSVKEISEFFNFIDFGIASSPVALLGKSSAVAAMLDHGVPVVANRDDCAFRGVDAPRDRSPLIHLLDGELEEKLRKGLPKHPPHRQLAAVAASFLKQLGGV